ncbi:Carboxylesterase [Roseomonas mucosa]|uniref:alpha/beta hydrolase n=1 Tax=Roseomonas mucosa TaxID=207340 RepID=UPI002207BFD9|nr:prolyl oligopeptidase family serine peptidase [Roseomonas mucosa]QDJ09510.1 Carboxylesterase [Roseomonas mucosa]
MAQESSNILPEGPEPGRGPARSRGPPSGRTPRQLVLLLHGVGARGDDLLPFAPALGGVLPDALFLAPDAPEPYDGAPFGRQWFSLEDRRPAVLVPAIRAAAPLLARRIAFWLDRLGLDSGALVLLGFSQGAMMALHAGLRLPHPPAAILAYAGALLDPEGLEREMVRPPPPVLLVHGEVDPVVPAEASRRAALRLRQFGVPVEALFEPGVDHTISPEGMMAGAAFLRRCMKPS